MQITFSEKKLPKAGVLVIALNESLKFGTLGAEINKKTGGALQKAMKIREFKGKKNEIVAVVSPSGVDYEQVILVGIGKDKNLDDLTAQSVGGAVYACLNIAKAEDAVLLIENIKDVKEFAAQAAYGALLRSYRFDK